MLKAFAFLFPNLTIKMADTCVAFSNFKPLVRYAVEGAVDDGFQRFWGYGMPFGGLFSLQQSCPSDLEGLIRRLFQSGLSIRTLDNVANGR